MGDAVTSPELGIEGLHLFSFNQVEETVRWQRKITAASFRVRAVTAAGNTERPETEKKE